MSVTIFVPDLPDFSPLIRAVNGESGITVIPPKAGYWQLQTPDRVIFSRKGLGLRVALWYSMLAGGYCGRMVEYSRDTLTIDSEEQGA